jgi:hypothetical protein
VSRLRLGIGWWWAAGGGGGYAGICAGCLCGIGLSSLWSDALRFAWSDGLVDVDWDWRHGCVGSFSGSAACGMCRSVALVCDLSRLGEDVVLVIAGMTIGERDEVSD